MASEQTVAAHDLRATPLAGEVEWWRKPLRIAQTNLQVRDTPRIHPVAVMRDLAAMHNNVAILNAGGIYAWYPTQVPNHTRNPYLDGRDVLEEAVESAHVNGMRFVARVDFSLADDSVYQQHPDWFCRSNAGEPILIGEPRPGEWSLLYATCPNGPYRNEAVAFPVLREVAGDYAVDGLFINAAHFRPCWCGTCRRLYRAEVGSSLPEQEDWHDPNWHRWIEWRYDKLAANFGAMYRVIQEARPGLFWTSEFGAITNPRPWQAAQDLVRLAHNCTLLTTGSGDNIAAGRPPTWLPAIHAKFARTLMGDRVPWATVHPTPGLVWRHTGLPNEELRLWLAQVNAHGAHAWHAMTGIPETHADRRNLAIHKEFNDFLRKNEEYFGDTQPITPVAVLWSRRALERFGQDDPVGRWQEEFFGFCDALINRQIPFTVIPDEHLADDRLSAFRVLVLPGAACLTNDEAAAVGRFVEQGRGLVASFGVGLLDAAGQERHDLALAKVLGVRFSGHILQELVASYMRIEDPSHPLMEGIGPTDLIPNQFSLLMVEALDGTMPLLTLVPTFAPATGVGTPPERASIPTPRTSIPVVLTRGNRIYFANEIGKLAWRFKLPDHATLIANAVRSVLPEPLPVVVEAPYGVQVSLFRQRDRLMTHLVNASVDRPRADAIPIHDIRLRITTQDRSYRRARALAISSDLRLESSPTGQEVVLPRLDTWEVIAFDP